MATLLRVMDQAWAVEVWHPPLSLAIEGLPAEQAAWRPNGRALTAWQFVNHVAFWKEAALRRLTGVPRTAAEDDNVATFGAPGDGRDAAAWAQALDRLHTAHAQLRAAVVDLTDADLADPSRERLLYAAASHDAYHGAEIVQLRKLQGAWPESR